MERTSAGWTGGEIVTTIAPMFDLSPEDINHAAVVITDNHGNINMIGCKHAESVVRIVAYETSGNDPGSHYVGNLGKIGQRRFRRWLASLL